MDFIMDTGTKRIKYHEDWNVTEVVQDRKKKRNEGPQSMELVFSEL